MLDILKDRTIDNLQEVLVFGAGQYGGVCIYLLQQAGIKVLACMDNSSDKDGKLLFDSIVCKKPYYEKDVPVIVSPYKVEVAEKIAEQCRVLGYTDILFLDFDKLYKEVSKIPDKEYLDILYRAFYDGYVIDWNNPKRFTEKIQWLKLHDRHSEYAKLVDKYEVKEYITEKLGEEYIIPTLGIWNSFAEIDFDKLPNQFVLKATHDSGSVFIVRDKKTFDIELAKSKLQRAIGFNFYELSREWVYKDLQPRIIAEKYMEDSSSPELKDYKIFCFHGKPRMILTVTGGHEDESRVVRRMYNEKWERFAVGIHGKENEISNEPKPELLDKMLEIASKLSDGIKHVRVDLYVINNKIYFGEMTFYHMGGFEYFKPESYDELFGNFLDLRE